ncbi:MAG: MG2 domain-containing protein, partial [Planctomycetota bacterium]
MRVAAVLSLLALLAFTPRLFAEESPEEVIQRAYRLQQGGKGGLDESIEVLEKYLDGHKKAGRVRVTLAQFYEQANRKSEAKKAYRFIVDNDEEGAGEAGYRLMNLLEFGFYMWSDRTWGPGDTPQVSLNVWSHREKKHPESFECDLYKLDADKLHADWAANPRALEQLLNTPPKGSATKIATWDQDWPKQGYGEPLKLEKAKGTGIYVFVAKPHGIPFRMPIVVAPHALVVKRSPKEVLVFAADRATGTPLAGVKLQTFTGKLEDLGTTGKDGTWSGKSATNDVIGAWHEGSLAASHGWVHGYHAVGQLFAHFSTDRPIYRPGHKVQWKAIVRGHGDGDYVLPEKGKHHVIINDPNGAEVWKGDCETNSYGTFGGTVELKEGCPLGHYSVNLGGLGYYQFRVEEYRKPEYQVKVQAPAFTVQGDSFKAKISAKYYFGAPVTKAEVHWEVYRRPHWRPWWTLFPCRDAWFYDDEVSPWGYYYGHGNLVKQGNGSLDKDGNLAIDVTVDKTADPNSRYYDEAVTVVARVVDASRREETGSAEVLAPKASFSVYAQPERWVYRPGDEIALQIRAMDPENKPVANVAVTTTAEIREYRKEGGWRATKKVASVEGTTDASGFATLKLSADARGSLEVTVTAKDENGREVKAQAWVWLCDEMWASPTHEGLQCIADKRSYSVGDTATILCTMPQEKGSALITREREGISHYAVESWEKGVLLLKAKVEEKDVPNFYMTVTFISGALHSGQADIVVIPEKKLLDVTVSFDKPTYQPKEKAIVKVKAVERGSKKGVKCEVALGVVDASLYALATDPAVDLRKFYWKKRPHTVTTNSSFQWWVSGTAGGNAAMQEASADRAMAAPAPAGKAMAAEGRARRDEAKKEKGGLDDSTLVEAEVRKDFPDTWVWKGELETDENGEASIELTTPDSLTTWRA